LPTGDEAAVFPGLPGASRVGGRRRGGGHHRSDPRCAAADQPRRGV